MSISGFLKTSNNEFAMPTKTDIASMNFVGFISEIKKGNIRIPDFQRDYIWTSEQVSDLLDSIWNGYPIGSVLLWKTLQKLNERDPLHLQHSPLSKNSERLYLLDGQQRLVTLYAIIHDILEFGKKRKTKYRAFFDLKDKKFYIYKVKDIDDNKAEPKIEKWFLPLNELMIFDYNTMSARQNDDVITRYASDAELLKTYVDLFIRFNSLEFPSITNGQNLSVATKIFERLNNTGTPLTIVDLMIAITYNENFNLRTKLEELVAELEPLNFEISYRTILQCMAACLSSEKNTSRDAIILSSEEIEPKWKKSIDSIKLSIDFLKKHCSIPVSNFLPNEILLAPLTYFFYNRGNKQLNNSEIKQLKRYFWFNILSERYTSSQDTMAETDIKEMDKLLSNQNKSLFDYYKDKISFDDIILEEMSFGSAFSKAILCFLASKKPLEFRNNGVVDLGQTFADANLKQLHHIFPENFIKKELTKKEKPFSNSIANISLISRVTNREIWDERPSLYFKEFERQNKELDKALESHFINDFKSIKKDDYLKFLELRAKEMENGIKDLVKSLK